MTIAKLPTLLEQENIRQAVVLLPVVSPPSGLGLGLGLLGLGLGLTFLRAEESRGGDGENDLFHVFGPHSSQNSRKEILNFSLVFHFCGTAGLSFPLLSSM